jgi:hypothetical protein
VSSLSLVIRLMCIHPHRPRVLRSLVNAIIHSFHRTHSGMTSRRRASDAASRGDPTHLAVRRRRSPTLTRSDEPAGRVRPVRAPRRSSRRKGAAYAASVDASRRGPPPRARGQPPPQVVPPFILVP